MQCNKDDFKVSKIDSVKMLIDLNRLINNLHMRTLKQVVTLNESKQNSTNCTGKKELAINLLKCK